MINWMLNFPFLLFSQVFISARHRTFVKERNRWMDFTGLGITLSTTGRCLTSIIIFCIVSCIDITACVDIVVTGTSGSSLTATSSWSPPLRILWSLFLACVLRTSGTPSLFSTNSARIDVATSKIIPQIEWRHFSRLLHFVSFYRMDSALLGHFRLSQETDNQTKVFAVVCKRKEEVRIRVLSHL